MGHQFLPRYKHHKQKFECPRRLRNVSKAEFVLGIVFEDEVKREVVSTVQELIERNPPQKIATMG